MSYQGKLIFSLAMTLKTFTNALFLSRQLIKQEAQRENEALVRRCELISQFSNPTNLQFRDSLLFVQTVAKSQRQ